MCLIVRTGVHTWLNENFREFTMIKLRSENQHSAFLYSRAILAHTLKKIPFLCKTEQLAEACSSTSFSEEQDPVSTSCLTCSISHSTYCSHSYCFVRSARGWTRCMWGALFSDSFKYWYSLTNPRPHLSFSSSPSFLLSQASEKPTFLMHLLLKIFNSLLLCGTVCTRGAERGSKSRDNFFINLCGADNFYFISRAFENCSNINSEKRSEHHLSKRENPAAD